MPHIDEGALQAYLDGALDEYPTREADHVRRHLEACAVCRERLESERSVRDRATEILGLARPDVSAPALEDLRAHVRARVPRRSPTAVRVRRIGWAASIVLAVGTGWVLRGTRVGTDDSAEAMTSLLEGASDERTTPAQGEPGSSDQLGGPDAVEGPDADPAGTGLEGPATSRSLPVRSEFVSVVASVPAFEETEVFAPVEPVRPDLSMSAPPLPEAPRLDLSSVAGSELLAASPGPGDQTDVEVAAAELERPASPEDVLTSASRVTDRGGVTAFGRAPQDGDDAPDDLTDGASYSLVVPDLEVLDVRFRGEVRPEGQVVLQRLASGDTLQVIHLPAQIEPGSLEPADAGHRQLVLQTASGWIVMRAPVGEDELMELMRSLLSEY